MKVGVPLSSRPVPWAGAPNRHARPPSERAFHDVLVEGAARAPAVRAPDVAATRSAAAPDATLTPSPSPSPLARGLARALDGAAAGEARLDALLEAAARGKTFTAAELLAMQATVFRYSQTIEVLSRATDRLVGAVKQTLGTQV